MSQYSFPSTKFNIKYRTVTYLLYASYYEIGETQNGLEESLK